MPKDPGLRLTVYCDGAARGNPGPAGIGVVVRKGRRVIDRLSDGIGVATNNVAEYRAALAGLERSAHAGATHLVLRSDSKLLVEQLSGRYRVKNPTLIRLHGEVRGLLERFQEVRFEHVPRELNREADRLANEGVDRWLAGPGKSYRPPEPAPNLFD